MSQKRHRPGFRRLVGLVSAFVTVTALAVGAAAVSAGSAVAEELVVNGTFDGGVTAPWWNSGNTTMAVEDGRLRVGVPGGTTQVWDALAGQSGIPLTAGTSYTVTFEASASAGMPVHARLQQEAPPHDAALDRRVRLRTETEHFEFSFTSGLSASDGQLVFQLGGQTQDATVLLDNVSLSTGGVVEPGNPIEQTDGFYVWPDSNPAKWVRDNDDDPRAGPIQEAIASKPIARWFGREWVDDVQATVSDHVTAAAADNKLPVLVNYNMYNRDCGGASQGGARTPEEYRTWVSDFAAGIGNRPAIVILEPDALGQADCIDDVRLDLLRYATEQFAALPNTWAYLDAGNANWPGVDQMADHLPDAGLGNVHGLAVNVSNFYTTQESTDYAEALNSAMGTRLPFVVDTSRNGNGSLDGQWCNPPDRRLGTPPQAGDGAETLLWIKTPGDSDGNTSPDCDPNMPPAGKFDPDLAMDLIGDTGGSPGEDPGDLPADGFPTPATTGVPPGTGLTVHEGDYEADTDGEVIDGMLITGTLFATAQDVTVRNSEIHGGVTNVRNGVEGSFRLIDSTVGPPSGCRNADHPVAGVSHDHYEAIRVQVRGFSDGFRNTGGYILIEDSYVKLCSNEDDHSDGIQGYRGGPEVVVRHNTIDQRDISNRTAPLFWADESEGSVIVDNLLAGGGYTVRLYGTGYTFSGNMIVDGEWQYGPVDSDCPGIDWSDNHLVTINDDYEVTSTVGPLECS